MQCGSVVTSIIEDDADGAIEAIESETEKNNSITIYEEPEIKSDDEKTHYENIPVEQATTGTGMNFSEEDKDETGSSSCSDSDPSSSDTQSTALPNNDDDLLRISSASINAAIMEKLEEYELRLRASEVRKEKIAANLINQAMAVLKMNKT